MVYRIYSEKKSGLDNEAQSLLSELQILLGLNNIEGLRILNRYDVEGADKALFDRCIHTVFSEPTVDNTYFSLPTGGDAVFAVEYLPGQFDQRADSAAQCIQLLSQSERPKVRSAKVYILYGDISSDDIQTVQNYVINPVDSRIASIDEYKTLAFSSEKPAMVGKIDGFIKMKIGDLKNLLDKMGLAMDIDDLIFCKKYFASEDRDPTITEIRMIDTYWSDHCRHTTFLTSIDSVEFHDELIKNAFDKYSKLRVATGKSKPMSFMDIATMGAKYLSSIGELDKLDKSDEINACTVKIDVETDGKTEKWLLLFKNETHNHPTEIEPFGGAATCIGGAIRDPLSGRAYVYQAMRITGASDPLKPISDTIPGKLPQRKIVTTAANGYSSYGNQIGLATGLVDEIYHDGYSAKRMEIGAVVGAVPEENVRREVPKAGDVVILLGGKTGRDGCGGATGSSKSHNVSSLTECGAEVQKGNAPEERKLQRLFRDKNVTKLIKRCNDFGAGGVSVAIGELADGLRINLNAVPKKYDGLSATELAISESQERMAVVVESSDAEKFIEYANRENIEATVVACVTDDARLVMEYDGIKIVDISREFLDSNGAEKHTDVVVKMPKKYDRDVVGSFSDNMKNLVSDLNVCSKKGLSERFDSTIGAGSVLMPFGGKYQMTPTQVMAAKIPMEHKTTDTCSVMSWGYNPYITEKSPYHGAYLAVVESISRLVASGAPLDDCYLTFQEYFKRLGSDPTRWGEPLSALLGSLMAQIDYGFASVGGKDSMSGTFENIDVPPTLVSFAITVADAKNIISPEFKKAGSRVYLFKPKYTKDNLPEPKSHKKLFENINSLIKEKKIISAWTPSYGGVAEAVFKMCLGNKIGFEYSSDINTEDIFSYSYGAFVAEATCELDGGIFLGTTTDDYNIIYNEEKISADMLQAAYESKLEPVFPCKTREKNEEIQAFDYMVQNRVSPKIGVKRPKVVIPVFPGTNCEYDTAKRLEAAGAEPVIKIINNLSAASVAESVDDVASAIRDAQIIFIPGGFSGGDEPDGSGKFITAFFRNPKISLEVNELLKKRDGLMAGICNGFQALIKLGLVPYGEISEIDESSPTLTFNNIGRHQSMLVRTRVCSNKSPWLSNTKPGDIYTVAVSHGEGKFLCDTSFAKKLAENGQIAMQYVDLKGNPTYQTMFNPNGSVFAVEAITSPDGRVFGKMGHSERIGDNLYKNVDGVYDMKMFESAVEYFKI